MWLDKTTPSQEYAAQPALHCSWSRMQRMQMSWFNDGWLQKGVILLSLASRFLPAPILQLCGHKVDQFSSLANGKLIIPWSVIFPPDWPADWSQTGTRSSVRVVRGVPVQWLQAGPPFRSNLPSTQCHTGAGSGCYAPLHPDMGCAHLHISYYLCDPSWVGLRSTSEEKTILFFVRLVLWLRQLLVGLAEWWSWSLRDLDLTGGTGGQRFAMSPWEWLDYNAIYWDF